MLIWHLYTFFIKMSVSVFNSFFFFFFLISWRLITLQYCSGFCHTLTWISHGFPCIPHPDPPSHIPLHPIPLGLRSAPGPLSHLLLLFLMQFFIFLSFFFFFFFFTVESWIFLSMWDIRFVNHFFQSATWLFILLIRYLQSKHVKCSWYLLCQFSYGLWFFA